MSAEAVAEIRPMPGLHAVDEGTHLGPEIIQPLDVEFGMIPTGYLNKFSQQRPGDNEQQAALTNSLRGGQINPINIVMATPELAHQYLEFTNQAWGAEKQPDELRAIPSGRFAGMYAILVAGHSRVEGLRSIATQDNGDPDAALVKVQMHPTDEIMEILRIQLNENIHAQVPKDRTLRAIAEMYLFVQSLNGGHRVKYSDFGSCYRVSEQMISDAMQYVALPAEIRRLTDDGILNVGIIFELARARLAIVKNAQRIARGDPRYAVNKNTPVEERGARQAAQQTWTDKLVLADMHMLMTRINNLEGGPNKNVIASRAIIRQYAKALRPKIAAGEVGPVVVQDAFDFIVETVDDRYTYLKKQFEDNLREFFGRDRAEGRDLARRMARLGELSIEGADTEDSHADLQGAFTLIEA